jgi:solute carrier family 25 phosphate transporter 3
MAMQERKLPFGKIEPNSGKYFVSCALGGIIGMFSLSFLLKL